MTSRDGDELEATRALIALYQRVESVEGTPSGKRRVMTRSVTCPGCWSDVGQVDLVEALKARHWARVEGTRTRREGGEARERGGNFCHLSGVLVGCWAS